MLFDEFDALGRERNDPSEHGEIKRVVNSFLQLLDGYTGPAMLIAATNHEEILDRALWRRFDEVVEFPLPTVREIRMLLGRGLKHMKSEPLPIDEMGTKLRGLPHAAVEATAWTAIRKRRERQPSGGVGRRSHRGGFRYETTPLVVRGETP